MTPTLTVSPTLEPRHPRVTRRRRRTHRLPADTTLTAIGLLVLLCLSSFASTAGDRWAWSALEAGILGLTALWLLRCRWTARPTPLDPTFWLTACIPLLGVIQVLAGIAVYRHATREAILYWAAMACVLLLSRSLCVERSVRQALLVTLAALAVALAMVNMAGLVSAGGLIPASGWTAFGLLASSNQFAELIELAMPICLARALLDRKRWLMFALLAAVLYAAAIGSRSRMGAALATAEIIAVLFCARWQRLVSSRHWRKVTVLMVVLAAGLALAIGVTGLLDRLRDPSPFAGRSEIFAASLEAFRSRPLTGFGLGSFSTVYPAFAVSDLGGLVNHAHDEWLEALCDGGLPLLAILWVIFGRLIRPAARSLWGLGLVAVVLHGAVDFPLQRLGICAWTFLIAGALEAAPFSKPTDLPVVSGPATAQILQ